MLPVLPISGSTEFHFSRLQTWNRRNRRAQASSGVHRAWIISRGPGTTSDPDALKTNSSSSEVTLFFCCILRVQHPSTGDRDGIFSLLAFARCRRKRMGRTAGAVHPICAKGHSCPPVNTEGPEETPQQESPWPLVTVNLVKGGLVPNAMK